MIALRKHIVKYKDPDEAEKHAKELKLHMQEFEEAMKKIRPLSSQELTMYKRISEEFGKPEIGAKRRGSKDGDVAAGGIT